MDWTQILTAALGVAGTVMAVLIGNYRNKTVWEYKIGELEKKMDKHNDLVVKVYGLEKGLSEVCVRVENLEKKG